MNGLNRGSFSFVALLVINPIVILMYQNCSVAPLHQNKAYANTYVSSESPAHLSLQTTHGRSPASTDGPASKEVKAHQCLSEHQTCYTPGKIIE